jgi:uncharacterized protein YqjF (DUF2071 family)
MGRLIDENDGIAITRWRLEMKKDQNKGLYVRNRQGLFLAPGRPDRKFETVRWVRTLEEAGDCQFWIEADDRRMKLYAANPRATNPDIVDAMGVVVTPERARLEHRFSENDNKLRENSEFLNRCGIKP